MFERRVSAQRLTNHSRDYSKTPAVCTYSGFKSKHNMQAEHVFERAVLAVIAPFLVSMETKGTRHDMRHVFHFKDKIRGKAEKVTTVRRKVDKRRQNERHSALNTYV